MLAKGKNALAYLSGTRVRKMFLNAGNQVDDNVIKLFSFIADDEAK